MFSGINVGLIRILAYMISGLAASVGGIMIAARTQYLDPSFGVGMEMDVLTCMLLGCVLAGTRAIVEQGWIPHTLQVGQSGTTVGPDLYIAVGVSGAIQHIVGMSSSKTIIAINKDPDAPIFKTADLGIVGDGLEILPILSELIRKEGSTSPAGKSSHLSMLFS